MNEIIKTLVKRMKLTHQNLNWCSHKCCPCYFSFEEIRRNSRIRQIQIGQTSIESQQSYQTICIRIKESIKVTLTREQTRQALKLRKSLGTVSTDIFRIV